MKDTLMDYRGRKRFLGNVVHVCNNCGKISEEKLTICCDNSLVKRDYQLSGFGNVISYAGEWDGIFQFPSVTVKLKENIIDREGNWVGIEEPTIGKPAECRVRMTDFQNRPYFNTPHIAYSEALAKNTDFKIDYKGNDVGIRGWGSWLGFFAVEAKEFGPSDFKEKRIGHPTEDSFTLAAEAVRYARMRAGCDLKGPLTIRLGTEYSLTDSQPYANLLGTKVNCPPNYDGSDEKAACLAGMYSFFDALFAVVAGDSDEGISAGSDIAGWLGRKDKDLRRFTGDAASALEVGKGNKKSLVATVIKSKNGRYTWKHSSFTPDYDVNKRGEAFHEGRFTGEPGYFEHTANAAKGFITEFGLEPKDFTFAVLHAPNLGFPTKLGKSLGFTDQQMEPNIKISTMKGNGYSDSVELCYAFEHSKPGDRIWWEKYGSGAGGRVAALEVLEGVEERKYVAPTVEELLAHKKMITVAEHDKIMKLREQILGFA
jgi:hydroxymethylglutaryl-CoA synthase